DLAGWIVRRVDDDRSRLRAEGLPQTISVEMPVRWNQRHHDRRGAREDAIRAVVLVEGFENNHLVARIDQRQDARQHGFGHAAADRDPRLGHDCPPPSAWW